MTINNVSKLNIFIGKNDTGKSNVLRALDLYFNNKIDKEPLVWERDFNITYKKARGKNAPTFIAIYIKFILDNNYSKSKLYKTIISNLGNEFFIGKRIYANRSEMFYSKNENALFKHPLPEDNEWFDSVTTFISYIHYFYIPINKDENWLKDSYIFKDIKNRFIDAWGKGGKTRKNIAKLKTQISSLLIKIKENVDKGMEEITKDFQVLFDEYDKVTFTTPTDPNDLFGLLDIEVTSSNNISTNLGVRGSGVQSASIPLLLYYVDTGKALAARNSLYFPIWGIEEPESFQHNDLEKNLSDIFFSKISKKISVFLTTHSINYLRPDGLDITHLFKLENGVSQLTEEDADWDQFFRETSREMGFLNMSSDIYQALKRHKDQPFVIFEGKLDIDIFNKCCSIDSNIKRKFMHYVVIDGEGRTITDKIKLLSKSGNSIIVVLDDDEDGRGYYRFIDNLNCSNIKLYQYSVAEPGNCVLETLIPDEVRKAFEKTMPNIAREYWGKSNKKMDIEIYQPANKAPDGWDKSSIKSKLIKYYTSNYNEKKYYLNFIKFYNSIAL